MKKGARRSTINLVQAVVMFVAFLIFGSMFAIFLLQQDQNQDIYQCDSCNNRHSADEGVQIGFDVKMEEVMLSKGVILQLCKSCMNNHGDMNIQNVFTRNNRFADEAIPELLLLAKKFKEDKTGVKISPNLPDGDNGGG